MIKMFCSPPPDLWPPASACEVVIPPDRLRYPAHPIPVSASTATVARAASTRPPTSARPRFGGGFRRWRGGRARGRTDVSQDEGAGDVITAPDYSPAPLERRR